MATNYPTSLDSYTTRVNGGTIDASHINNLQDAIVQLETKLGVNSSGTSSSIDYKVNNFFSTGRKLWVYEDSAPIGWTIVSSTDRVLAVKGGTGTYNSTGGSGVGSWVITGSTTSTESALHYHLAPSHAHIIDHTHTGTAIASAQQVSPSQTNTEPVLGVTTTHTHTFTTDTGEAHRGMGELLILQPKLLVIHIQFLLLVFGDLLLL